MKSSTKQLKYASGFFFLVAYAAFYMYKVTMYNLFYYEYDMFSVLGSSQGWIYGHPLWWDNRYGFTPAVHFSFMAPFLSPLTILFGGKGLFIAHGLIFFIAFFYALHGVTDINVLKKRLAALMVFLISPYAFWLFDDTYFGWHIELLFLPFSIFFALALISAKRWLIISCALLLVLTKEDGIVIACCIHLLFILSHNTDEIQWKNILKTIAMWSGIFILSLFAIKFFNDFKDTRLEVTLNDFYHDTSHFNAAYFKKIIRHFILMVLPLSLFCFFVLSKKYFLKLHVCLLPLIITGIVSGFWYSGNTFLSLVWAPRFVETMGVMLAGIFIFLNQQSGKQPYKYKLPLAIVAVIIILMQGFLLNGIRDYNLFDQIKKAYAHVLTKKVTTANAITMKCISERIPRNYVVAVPYEYFNLFDKNDVFWFDHPENAPQKNPDLVIMDDSTQFRKHNFDYDQYHIERKNKFFILIRKDKMLPLFDCN